jgi:hypothetical protein
MKCVHHWLINANLRGVCLKCGAARKFPDPSKIVSAAEYRERLRQAQREVSAARTQPSR